MTRLRSYETGHCTHPGCMVQKGAGRAPRCFPSRAFLMETRLGPVLWDTGYAERFHDATRDGVYRLYAKVTPIFFEPRQALVAQLAADGIAARDVRAVVLSHFHADHIAGLRDFPNARVIASEAGWLAVRGKTGIAALRQGFLPDLLPFGVDPRLSFAEGLPLVSLPAALAPFERGYQLVAGEVWLVPLPGHAAGHLGAFVHTDEGWVLLASDAAWTREAITHLAGPSELTFLVQDSRRQYYQTLRRLQQLEQHQGARILLAHVEENHA